ncbi:MAG: hypothetical protein IJY94_02230 [Clostridia bacterium]|nr:hypothetical protein [Clostridia bacterium]
MRFSAKGKEHTKQFHPDDRRCCKIECICACTGLLFFLPLVSVPGSKFGRYWANQGLIMLFCELIMLIAGFLVSWLLGLLALIPFIGILFNVVKVIAFIALGLIALFVIVLQGSFAARGRAIDMPFVGFIRFIK